MESNNMMDSVDEYFQNMPPGYRFCPYDNELVGDYLKPKVFNKPLPKNQIIDVNIYLYNPEILTEKYKQYGEKDWYFFTPREKKYRNGSRPNRAAGDGYWKATGADKQVRDTVNTLIGFKKSLVFYKGKPPHGDKTNWIMHEYRVNDPPPRNKTGENDMRLDAWILCRMYKKIDKSKTSPQDQQHVKSNDGLTSSESTSLLDHHHHEPMEMIDPVDVDHDKISETYTQDQQQDLTSSESTYLLYHEPMEMIDHVHDKMELQYFMQQQQSQNGPLVIDHQSNRMEMQMQSYFMQQQSQNAPLVIDHQSNKMELQYSRQQQQQSQNAPLVIDHQSKNINIPIVPMVRYQFQGDEVMMIEKKYSWNTICPTEASGFQGMSKDYSSEAFNDMDKSPPPGPPGSSG